MATSTTVRHRTIITAALLAAVCAAPFEVAAKEPALARVVPDDVLLFIAGYHNPESAFIDDYWQDVFDAVMDSGIGEDVMGLLGSVVGMEEMEEVHRLKARAAQLLDGVNWEQLHKGEMVFAERLPPPIQSGRIPNFGPANLVWLCRGTDERTVAANFQGLVEILNAIVEELNNVAGDHRLSVERSTKGSAEVASANLLAGFSRAPELTLIAARRGDLLLIALGEPLLNDVLGMLEKPGARRSIADDPRFRAVFAELPPPENSLTFFNVQALLKPMRQFKDMIIAQLGAGSDEYENAEMSPMAASFHLKSLDAYRAGHYEEALQFALQAHEIDPENSILIYNVACFSALTGLIEEALTWLEKAVEAGFYAPNKIASDSDLERLHDHPRFQAVLARAASKAQECSVKDKVINSTKSGEAFKLTSEAWRLYDLPEAGKREHRQSLQLVKQAYEIAPADSRVLYYLACFNALLGHTEKALDFLDQAVDGGYYCPGHISTDPDLDSIRETKRYETAVTRARDKAAQLAGGQANKKAALATGIFGRVIDTAGVFDYIATVQRTDGNSVHTETIAALVPNAKKNPIYKVFGQGKPLNNFDRYLPQETLSFSVSSGIDADALYVFLEDTLRDAGPLGAELLNEWSKIQKDMGLNIREDLLSWMGRECVHVTLEDDAGWVMMLKVTDEQKAQESVANVIDLVLTKMNDAMTRMPALAMLAMVMPRRGPLDHEKLEGFENLYFGMSPVPIVWGVADGYLIISASADAAALCLGTARGGHPNIRDNPRVMAEALLPRGGCTGISLSDRRDLGKELAMGCGVASMVIGSTSMGVPDPKAKAVIMRLASIVAKLAPVAVKIDFYKSAAAYTTFDGRAWHTRQVTHYFSPEERAARKPPPVATTPDPAEGL